MPLLPFLASNRCIVLGAELKQFVSAGGGKLGLGAVIDILVALWSTNGGAKAMFDSLNVVYGEHEKRGYIRRTLVSLVVTLGMLVFVTVVMAAAVALNFVGLASLSTSCCAWRAGHCCWSSSPRRPSCSSARN